MNRIENAMAALKEKGEKAFITYSPRHAFLPAAG